MSIKRIAFLSVHTSPVAPMGGKKTGGMNVYIRELSRELGKQGYEIDIFTRRSSCNEPIIDYSIGENVRVIYLNAGPVVPLTPDEHYPYLSEFTSNLIAYATLNKIQYDVLYSHYWLSGWVAAKLKEIWGIGFVQMFHTLGHMKQRIAKKPYIPNTRILTETYILQFADCIVAATPAEEEQLNSLYNADPKRITIIPPGVNIEHFRSVISSADAKQKVGLEPDSEMLLFVGRIEPLKAVDTILEAVYIVKMRSPEWLNRLRLVIVGGDPSSTKDSEMQRLRKMTSQLKIEQYVDFVGAKEQSLLPTYYSAATVVVMPSDYESFGMVALEAMATGTPVIASQVGGLAHLVRDRQTGFHIPARDSEALADRIMKLLAEPCRRRRMGETASQIAKEYVWSSIAKRIIQTFDDVTYKKTVGV